MRVLVCGSRTFNDEDLVESVLDGIVSNLTDGEVLVIIEGGAKGADALAAAWARTERETRRGVVEHETYPADWQQYGRAAGFIRNKRMLEEGEPDWAIAFLDKPLEESKGTRNMVTQARAAGLRVEVHAP